jgi:hypothetical protein
MTTKATHRGTCQVCGRAQAHFKGKIAKHGYTVQWGFFNGVCRGAEELPLEQDKTITEATIVHLLNEYAPAADKLAADLRSGAVEPQFYNTHYDRIKCKNVRTSCKRSELRFECYETQETVAERQIRAAIAHAESDARHARSHVEVLKSMIESRHGQPLMPINDRKLQAGDRVQMFGKKDGIICEVVKLDYAIARGCGPYMNGRSILHAFLKRPDGSIFQYPAQSIRRSAIIEGGAQ